jgi:hypothetical protein
MQTQQWRGEHKRGATDCEQMQGRGSGPSFSETLWVQRELMVGDPWAEGQRGITAHTVTMVSPIKMGTHSSPQPCDIDSRGHLPSLKRMATSHGIPQITESGEQPLAVPAPQSCESCVLPALICSL